MPTFYGGQKRLAKPPLLADNKCTETQPESSMNTQDLAIVNLPLSKRGDIDAQIDAYKKALAKEESIKANEYGVRHLHKAGYVRVFANWTQAEKAAIRTGGEAYQSPLSARFLVRFN
jgi:hypothetical protein